jgi:uncharacterized membrane-anchored protein YjiN (DUF445 family)
MKSFVSIPISTELFDKLVNHLRKNDLNNEPVDAVGLAINAWIESSVKQIDKFTQSREISKAITSERQSGYIDNEMLVEAISRIKGVSYLVVQNNISRLSSDEIAKLKEGPRVQQVVASILADQSKKKAAEKAETLKAKLPRRVGRSTIDNETLAEAMTRIKGLDLQKVKDYIEKANPDEIEKLKVHPHVRSVVATIRIEKAMKAFSQADDIARKEEELLLSKLN